MEIILQTLTSLETSADRRSSRARGRAAVAALGFALVVGCGGQRAEQAGGVIDGSSGGAAPSGAGGDVTRGDAGGGRPDGGDGGGSGNESGGGNESAVGGGAGAGGDARGGGGAGSAPCPPADCTFEAEATDVLVTCGPRALVGDVAPGMLAPSSAMRLAVTDRETLLAIGTGCGTDFVRVPHDGPPASGGMALSTDLDASRLALTTRPRQFGTSIAYLGVAPRAAQAGQVYVDNFGSLSLSPATPLVAFAGDEGAYWHDVAVAAPPDGTVHAIFDDRHFVYADASGAFTELAPRPDLGFGPASTTDATGELVTLWAVEPLFGSGAEVAMTLGASSTLIGDAGAIALRAVPPPSEFLEATEPTTAVVLQDGSGLYVAWPAASGGGRTDLPAATLHRTCTSDDGLYVDAFGCDGQTCEERASGVVKGAYAAGRSEDGSVWVAYVTSELDVRVAYGPEIEESCEAQRVLATDRSTASLHVLRVRADGGAPVEVLTASVGEPGTDYTGLDAVLLQAFDAKVAVAVLAFDPANALAARVFVVDAD